MEFVDLICLEIVCASEQDQHLVVEAKNLANGLKVQSCSLKFWLKLQRDNASQNEQRVPSVLLAITAVVHAISWKGRVCILDRRRVIVGAVDETNVLEHLDLAGLAALSQTCRTNLVCCQKALVAVLTATIQLLLASCWHIVDPDEYIRTGNRCSHLIFRLTPLIALEHTCCIKHLRHSLVDMAENFRG